MLYLNFFFTTLLWNYNFPQGTTPTEWQFSWDHQPPEFISHFFGRFSVTKSPKIPSTCTIAKCSGLTPTELQKKKCQPPPHGFFRGARHPVHKLSNGTALRLACRLLGFELMKQIITMLSEYPICGWILSLTNNNELQSELTENSKSFVWKQNPVPHDHDIS